MGRGRGGGPHYVGAWTPPFVGYQAPQPEKGQQGRAGGVELTLPLGSGYSEARPDSGGRFLSLSLSPFPGPSSQSQGIVLNPFLPPSSLFSSE